MDLQYKYADKAREYAAFYHNELLNNIIPFWTNSDMTDEEFGGCITSVDRTGKSYNNDKSVWFQGRCLWTFSALCRKYGIRDEWKKIADSAKKFLCEKCVDKDGRMYFTVTRDGRPLRKRRYIFSESFFVIGMAEYSAAFGCGEALEKAEKCYELMLKIYDCPESDPFKITPKTYSEVRNERSAAVPMVMFSCSQVLRRCDPKKADYYTEITDRIIGDILKYNYHPEMSAVLETVLYDGSFIDNPAGRTVNPGHSSENSWFLMNEAIYKNDNELLRKALDIFDSAFERGWDKEYGGVLYFTDVNNRPCEQLEWDMKLWWVHNEILIASLMAYNITGNEKYWDRFETVHSYAFSHFADKEYGEWYGYLHRDGSVSHTQKGSMWKGPFHLPRCLMLCEQLLERIAANQKTESIL